MISTTALDDLATRFGDTFGREHEVTALAPGRANLIGDYTDVNDGLVLPFAIAQGCVTLAAQRHDGVLRFASVSHSPGATACSVQLSTARRAGDWTDYVVGSALSYSRARQLGGADLLLASDVPIGAGLSSSAALECSVVQALSALGGADLAPLQLALLAREAENDFVGVPSGVMDQATSMCATAGHVLLLDTRSLSFSHVPLDLAGAQATIVAVDTRVRHDLAGSDYSARVAECRAAAGLLGVASLRELDGCLPEEIAAQLDRRGEPVLARRVRHVLSENERVRAVAACVGEHRLDDAGRLLLAGHESLRADFEVSCPELDAVVEVAISVGAIGARMTGAGFGGSVLVLLARALVPVLGESLRDQFARRGWPSPGLLEVAPSAGARLL